MLKIIISSRRSSSRVSDKIAGWIFDNAAVSTSHRPVGGNYRRGYQPSCGYLLFLRGTFFIHYNQAWLKSEKAILCLIERYCPQRQREAPDVQDRLWSLGQWGSFMAGALHLIG